MWAPSIAAPDAECVAAHHSSLGIRRAQAADHATSLTVANDLAIRRALESAGVEFIDEDGGGPSIRLRKRHQKKT
jgi:hypothetical protein